MFSQSETDRKNLVDSSKRRLVAATVGTVVIVGGWPGVAGAWQFDTDPDTSCAVHKEKNFDLNPAQLYFMLDESGSMDGWKWTEATDAIDATVDQMTYDSKDDVVQFGLGWFSGSAETKVDPQEDSYSGISSALNHSPSGGTRMDEGLENARPTLAAEPDAASRPQATMLITDGYPNSGSEQLTVDAACDHRADAPVYVVGFGSGTYQEFNDLVAAAGGTGYCCKDGVSCTESGTSNHTDPCASGEDPINSDGEVKSNWECHGSRQVSGGSGLQTVATEVANKLACQIDVSENNLWQKAYSESGYGCASNNYSCLKVDWGGSLGTLAYTPNDPDGTGWRWSDTNTQDTIVLNKTTCNEIAKETTSDEVTIERACMCDGKTAGASCDRPGAATCGCLEGTISCFQSNGSCQPNSPCGMRNTDNIGSCSDSESNEYGTCSVSGSNVCSGTTLTCGVSAKTPAPEGSTCDGVDNNCNGRVDEGVVTGSCTIDSLQGRCAIGQQLCDGTCEQIHRPVPEICNGLDDDCNGVVDDIGQSWEQNGSITLSNLSQSDRGRACGKTGACICDPGEADDSYRGSTADGSRQAEFDEMVEQTQSSCVCRE